MRKRYSEEQIVYALEQAELFSRPSIRVSLEGTRTTGSVSEAVARWATH